MATFEESRARLNEAQARAETARDRAAAARDRSARLAEEVAAAQRSESRRAAETARRLREALGRARVEEEETRTTRDRLATEAARARAVFEPLADPRRAVGALDDGVPILLMPVRLETRFRRVAGADGEEGEHHELWVRVYPDDCQVDTFEATLSENELESGRAYWIESWAAGGVDADERGAWRNLVASRGVGRAAWIIRQFQPVNAGEKPTKAAADEVVLVIASDAPPPVDHQNALAAYWKAVWLADGGATATTIAAAALAAGVGTGVAATLVERHLPANLRVAPPPPRQRADVSVRVAWLVLPSSEALAPKLRSWSAPARVRLMPDRFVVLGYQGGKVVLEGIGAAIPSSLIAGPDPSAPATEQLRQTPEGELEVAAEMAWMVDFDEAVKVGMGLKIRIEQDRVDLEAPFERLIAVGVRLADDAEGGRAALEELLAHHRYGRFGLSLVRQGTPTNNTEAEAAGYRRLEDADAAYDAIRGGEPPVPTASWFERSDGQWLTDALGITPAALDGVQHAGGRDLAEARAMNRALWPATLGYAMETLLHPVFTSEQVDTARWFFTHFVVGRGFLPSLRIGDQPYGVLPIAPLARLGASLSEASLDVAGLEAPSTLRPSLVGLARLLGLMRADWEAMAQRSAFVGQAGDPHATLLDVLGLHPSSVEYHQRQAESLDHLFNRAKLQGMAAALMMGISERGLEADGTALLQRLGHAGAPPDILDKFFFGRAHRLNGPIIDDRPLSETEAIRVYTGDGRNYLRWLLDATALSLEELRLERGFAGDKAPDALLYVWLRHALMLGYWDTSLRLQLGAAILSPAAAAQARREPAFIHVHVKAPDGAASESRLAHLYRGDERVTGQPDILIADHITANLGHVPATRHLDDQRAAIDLLKDVPTARLERCLAEHIDTASHRLDAWLLALVNHRLSTLRYRRDATRARTGLFVGAYGWLEDLRRKPEAPLPMELAGTLAETFSPEGAAPLLEDPTNAGHLLAPSLTQAATAAVLRAGYLSNASSLEPQAFAVDLSSARVRLALSLIEGIRNGQPLGALLGYRLQRGLHEGHGALELDRFLEPLRSRFPLVANKMQSTSEPGAAVEALEARNVVDGMLLVEHVRRPGNGEYPFGVALPGDASPAERQAVTAEIESLLEAHDALADLAMAEGVHQAVQGNYDRVASTLDAYAKGGFPPEPEVVRTPRSGTVLTHRVALHLEPGVDPTVSPVGFPVTPRAQAQAAVNKWLEGVLPAPAAVGCRVEWIDPAGGTLEEEIVTQEQLGLQPIDLISIATLDGEAGLTELDDRILRRVVTTRTPRADAVLTIRHTETLPDAVTFFELAPLVRSLRVLLLSSRPLAPSDLSLAGEAEQRDDAARSIDRRRVRRVRIGLGLLVSQVGAFAPGDVDDAIDGAVDLFERAARFGVEQVGWGGLYERRRRLFAELLSSVDAVVARWTDRLARFDAGLTAYLAAPPPTADEQFAALAKLDLLLAVAPISPRPPTPGDYQLALPARRGALAAKRGQLAAILTGAGAKLAPLVAAVQAALPIDGFDAAGLAVSDLQRQVMALRLDVSARVVALKAALEARADAADAHLAVHDASADSAARVESLQQAGRALLGESMQLVPELTLGAARGAELANALAAGDSGELTHHLTETLGIELPVEDWLHGMARVREKMRHLEQASMLSETLGKADLPLRPLQLPFGAGDRWLALELDPAQSLGNERLLYTAHYAADPVAGGAVCGLLLDEWTEVIPARSETPALAFHYDRPGSEPPQTWLLVTPARVQGAWHWNDIVDAVNEALALARLRTVEPQHVDDQPYARLLPATASAVTLHGVSIAANLARVNAVAMHLEGGSDG